MSARTPEELPAIFERCFNAGDIDGLMADYYAEDATYAPLPGEVVSGPPGVRAAIGWLVDRGERMDVALRTVLRSGDVALLIVDWVIPALEFAGTATDVARLQGDGTWKCVVDNPHGGARSAGP